MKGEREEIEVFNNEVEVEAKRVVKSDLLSVLSSDRGEPVDVVDGATLHGPLLHTASHTVSVLLGEGLASGYKVKTISSSKSFNQTGDVLTNGVLELHEEILAQGGKLCRVVEDIDSNALEHCGHRAGQVSHLCQNGRRRTKTKGEKGSVCESFNLPFRKKK